MSERIYEVTCRVRRDRVDDWLAWIGPHADAVLEAPGMLDATILRDEDDGADAVFVVAYRVADPASLEGYLSGWAPRLRADGVERFGEALRTSRRVMEVLAKRQAGRGG